MIKKKIGITWKIVDHAHVHGGQMLLRPDPGQEQEVGRVDGASRNDYFARGTRHPKLAVLNQ